MKFAKQLLDAQAKRSLNTKRHKYGQRIISHDQPFRITWDILLMCCLAYIVVALPFTMAFGGTTALTIVDNILDIFFLVDVVLNFFTTFENQDGVTITSNKTIASRYLKSWFAIDFVSSVPLDLLTNGLLPNFQPVRLLKTGKVVKVFKLLRIGKLFKYCQDCEIFDQIDEALAKTKYQNMFRLFRLLLVTALLCHWLASMLAFTDTGALDSYLDMEKSPARRYLAAVYWAMTTISTVGYGDMIPTSDAERACAIIAMVVGVTFYGYVIGCITSIISRMDLNRVALRERLDLVQSWLDYKCKIPKPVRKRIRRYYSNHMSQRTAIDDASVIAALPPDLRADTAYFLIRQEVRFNVLFQDFHNSVLAVFIGLLNEVAYDKGHTIVRRGDPGIAMCVIIEGRALVSEGQLYQLSTKRSPSKTSSLHPKLAARDSFGEEILFNIEEIYRYTIEAISDLLLCSISEDAFKVRFKNLPHLRRQMRDAFLQKARGGYTRAKQQCATKGLIA
jgi:hypothetical protein